ncbi:hypothetical protein [Salimicrobium album]|uniref:Uncharacterized protein n=1 Tax=Salimicrobium album TaxID=50717 RepID=A0A1H3ADY8_9BACI|nr:hypothetical protein [Salimicrobium album]SDX27681.1 hypothetical protein SAMN04488081_0020 [Salimicrobium album]
MKDYFTYSEEQEEKKLLLKKKGYVTYNLELVNESTMELIVNNAVITLDTNDPVEIHSSKTGEQTTLPTNEVDQDGNTIEVQVVKYTADGTIQAAFSQNALKCNLGIASTDGTAGLAGFGGLGIPGAIAGSVAGGRAGAQSAGFDYI